MDVIDRINERLAVIGKNGAEMSRDLGLSNSIYSQWNTGKTKPSKKTISLLAPYLKTTAEYLLTRKEKSPAPLSVDLGDGESKAETICEKDLSRGEEELIQLFRLLPDDLKAGILAQIEAVLKQRGIL